MTNFLEFVMAERALIPRIANKSSVTNYRCITGVWLLAYRGGILGFHCCIFAVHIYWCMKVVMLLMTYKNKKITV